MPHIKVRTRKRTGLLRGTRVSLSGPMDFVALQATEKKTVWRNRVGGLQAMGVTVFDPWFKPEVCGLHEYGQEDEPSIEKIRKTGPTGAARPEPRPRRGARRSSGRCCTLICRWWTRVILPSRMARPTSTPSAPRTKASWPRCNTSRCCSSACRCPFDTAGVSRALAARRPRHRVTRPAHARRADQGESERHSKFVVLAAARRRELFRWVWFRGVSKTI